MLKSHRSSSSTNLKFNLKRSLVENTQLSAIMIIKAPKYEGLLKVCSLVLQHTEGEHVKEGNGKACRLRRYQQHISGPENINNIFLRKRMLRWSRCHEQILE